MRAQRESRRRLGHQPVLSAGARSSQEAASAGGAGRAGESRRRSTPVELDRRQLLVASRRPADVGALRRGRRARGAARCSPTHGLNVTRSFCFWPDFVPAAGHLDETVAERFGDFLDAHVEHGLGTIPTFIVGHMSGENWDPAWRRGTRPLPGRLARLPAGLARGGDRGSLRRRTRRSSAGSSRTRCRCTADRARARDHRVGAARRAGGARRRVPPSRSRSATARGESRSPATTTATRCASSLHSSTSSVRTSIRCRTTRCGSS